MGGLIGVWDELIVKKEVRMNAKWEVFNAVIRPVASYGGQICGYRFLIL